ADDVTAVAAGRIGAGRAEGSAAARRTGAARTTRRDRQPLQRVAAPYHVIVEEVGRAGGAVVIGGGVERGGGLAAILDIVLPTGGGAGNRCCRAVERPCAPGVGPVAHRHIGGCRTLRTVTLGGDGVAGAHAVAVAHGDRTIVVHIARSIAHMIRA